MTTALQPLNADAALGDKLGDAARLHAALERDTLERSLHAFVVAAWSLVEPSQPFVDNWHLRELCKVLEHATFPRRASRNEAAQGERLLINVPPGTMKSLLIEVFWPAWVWARNAKKRFLFASYNASLTTRDNLRCRQIIESPWFQERWSVRMSEDQNAKTRYNTNEHGWRIATSVRGAGTGEHPDFIVIDDPTSAQQAASDADRSEANEWFDRTMSTRLGRNPTVIVVMQRLHQDDLVGHLLKRGGWTLVRWPMRFERCTCPPDADEHSRCPLHKADPNWTPDPRDPRTEDGELLWPAMYDEAKVRKLELDLGPFGAAGQLQQRPAPEGGGLFKREWFKFADAGPALARRVRGWDTAGSEGKGDHTVGVRMAEEFEKIVENGRTVIRSTGRFFVEDVQRAQLGPAGVDALMAVTAELDGKEVAVREEKEGGSSGLAVIAARTKTLKGFNYQGVQISGSKITRAKPFRAQAEAGNVVLVRAPWNEPYITELCAFPAGDHDDQVDGSSCAFNAVLLEEPPRTVKATW